MSSLFSLHRPYLILFIADQRQGLSPSAALYSGNEGGHSGDEEKVGPPWICDDCYH